MKTLIQEALKAAKKCQKCRGLLEPKFGDYHPICNPTPPKVYRNTCPQCRPTFPTGCGKHEELL